MELETSFTVRTMGLGLDIFPPANVSSAAQSCSRSEALANENRKTDDWITPYA
jgi:hypothetical protein